MTSSMIPNRSRSVPVNLRASAALGACSAPFQRIVAQPFGADDRVIGVLEHRDPVAQADPQGPAGAPLADHEADDRGVDPAHRHQGLGDGQGLAALLGGDPGVGARGVDEGDDRQAGTWPPSSS